MTAFLIFLSVLLPFAMGFLFLCAFWPADGTGVSDLLLKCCLSVGFGFGISSCIVFVWLLLAGRLATGFFVCQLATLAALSVLAMYRRKVNVSVVAVQSRNFSSSESAPWLIRCAFCLAFLCAVTRFLELSLQDPNGQFDATAHWNLEARFLYAGGACLKQYSWMTWAHPDYPLLVPASIAGAWALVGSRTTIVPCVIALLFTFSLVGLVSVSIARLRGERQGLLAGLCLLGTPFLIRHGASQYADVPVAFFFVAALALLFLNNGSPHRGFVLLSGAAAGLAAWTKNEGLLFAALLIALDFSIVVIRKGKTNGFRDWFLLWIGLAPVLVIILTHKIYMGQSNDLVVAQNVHDTTRRLLDISRYELITKQMVCGIFSFGEWNRFLPLPVLFVLYCFLAGFGIRNDQSTRPVILGALLILFMLIGYFSIYVLSPWDLAWHLETSVNRLLLQLLPLFIFVYFALVRAPAQIAAAKEVSN